MLYYTVRHKQEAQQLVGPSETLCYSTSKSLHTFCASFTVNVRQTVVELLDSTGRTRLKHFCAVFGYILQSTGRSW